MPIEAIKSASDAVIPPSTYLKEKFDGLGHYPPSESECDDIAKAVLLLPEQVSLWFEHLHTVQENRKRGAAHAAATKRKNRQEKGQEKRREKGQESTQEKGQESTQEKGQESTQDEEQYHCGTCLIPYQSTTDSVEDWIGSESCNYYSCVRVTSSSCSS